MKAVQKFDADKGIRPDSYAVWWIRAFHPELHPQELVLGEARDHPGATEALLLAGAHAGASWRKFDGATRRHAEGQRRRHRQEAAGEAPGKSSRLQQRMEGRDLSLDAPMGEDGGSSHVDFVMDGADLPDAEIAEQEERHIVQERVLEALSRLDPRERYIIEQRIMNDKPMTLKELGEHFGFSRERARQLEIRAKAKAGGRARRADGRAVPGRKERLAVAETA